MSRTRFSPGLLALAAVCVLGSTAADAATVAYYRFENGTAGEAAVDKMSISDSSGNDIHASPWQAPVYEAVGNPGSALALHFDGKAHVSVPDNPLLELKHSMTLEAYVKLESDACPRPGGFIVRSDNRYAYDPYYLSLGSTDCTLVFMIEQSNSETSYVLSPTPLPLEQWLHVAGTLDDATGLQSLYINGSLVASKSTPFRAKTKLEKNHRPGIYFGSNAKGSPDQGYLHGSIDEVRISDVALDPSQFLPPP